MRLPLPGLLLIPAAPLRGTAVRALKDLIAGWLGYPELFAAMRQMRWTNKRLRRQLAFQAHVIDNQAKLIEQLGGAPYDERLGKEAARLDQAADEGLDSGARARS